MRQKWLLPTVLATLFLISACVSGGVESQALPLSLEVASGSITQRTPDGLVLTSACTYEVGNFSPEIRDISVSVYLTGGEHGYTETTDMADVRSGSADTSFWVDDPADCLGLKVAGLWVVDRKVGLGGYYECMPITGSNKSKCTMGDISVDSAFEGIRAKRRV